MKKIGKIIFTVVLLCTGMVSAKADVLYLNGVVSGQWFDVNKAFDAEDSDLCWAASASNVLSYTGWNRGMSSEEIFASFKHDWTNNGGHPRYGIEWWFTGINNTAGSSGWAQLVSEDNRSYTQNYYGQESFDENFSPYQDHSAWFFESDADFEALISDFIDGHYALSLAIGEYSRTGERLSGHSITLWGIDAPNNMIYVTDSDDYFEGIKSYHYNNLYLTDYFAKSYRFENVVALHAVPEPQMLLLIVLGILSPFSWEIRRLCRTKRKKNKGIVLPRTHG